MLAFYQIQTERLILPGEMTVYLTRQQIEVRVNLCADHDHPEHGLWYRVSAYRHNNLYLAPGEIIGLDQPPPPGLAFAFLPLAALPEQTNSRLALDTPESSTAQPSDLTSSTPLNLIPLSQLRSLSAPDFFHLIGLTLFDFNAYLHKLPSASSQRGRPSQFTREQRLAMTLMYHQHHPHLTAAKLASTYGATESRICQIIRALTHSLNRLQLPLSGHQPNSF